MADLVTCSSCGAQYLASATVCADCGLPLGDEVGYDLSDWSDDQRRQLTDGLTAEHVVARWEDDELVVATADAERVEQLIEEIDGPELASEEDDADAGAELLSTLYVSADILQHDPESAPAIVDLLDAADQASELGAPYGLDPDVWRDIHLRADELAGLLGDDAPAEEVAAAARALREAVHPLV